MCNVIHVFKYLSFSPHITLLFLICFTSWNSSTIFRTSSANFSAQTSCFFSLFPAEPCRSCDHKFRNFRFHFTLHESKKSIKMLSAPTKHDRSIEHSQFNFFSFPSLFSCLGLMLELRATTFLISFSYDYFSSHRKKNTVFPFHLQVYCLVALSRKTEPGELDSRSQLAFSSLLSRAAASRP